MQVVEHQHKIPGLTRCGKQSRTACHCQPLYPNQLRKRQFLGYSQTLNFPIDQEIEPTRIGDLLQPAAERVKFLPAVLEGNGTLFLIRLGLGVGPPTGTVQPKNHTRSLEPLGKEESKSA